MSELPRPSQFVPRFRPRFEKRGDFSEIEKRQSGEILLAKPVSKNKETWMPFETPHEQKQTESRPLNPLTAAREAAMKLKAKKKREEDKAEKRRKELRGIKNITSFFDFSKPTATVLDITTDEDTPRIPLIIDDDNDDVDYSTITTTTVPTSTPKSEIVPRPPPKVDVQKQLHPYVRVALFDDNGEQIRDPATLDWPEMKMLHTLTRKMYLGCCSANECTFEEHEHGRDDTALGLARPPVVATSNQQHRCAMPVDAFDESQFPLFNFLPEALADNSQQSTNQSHTNNTLRMTHRNAAADMRYGGLMMRLRAQYFVELANVRASHAQSRTEIDTRYEPNLIIALTCDDEEYAEELKQARERERETVRNIFHARIDTLHTHMQALVVRTLVQCSTMTEFRLTMPMTTKACLDTIRLPGGAEHDEQFYSDLFIDIANGQLDELEHQKKLLSNEHNLSLDAYYSEFLERAGPGDHLKSSRTFNDIIRNASTDNMDEAIDDDNDEGEADSETEIEKFIADSDHRATPPPTTDPTPPLPPLPQKEHEQQDSQKKRKREDEINDEDGESEILRRVAYPCASQFAIADARTACTAIAFVMALRWVTTHLLNVAGLLGTTETIFTQLEYAQILNNGAEIWQKWLRARQPKLHDAKNRLFECEMEIALLQARGEQPSEELMKQFNTLQLNMRDLQSTFMHAPEVVETSLYVRNKLSEFSLMTYESAGFWNGNPSAIGDDDAPSLSNALAATEKLGVFSGVLTIGASSVCIAYTDDRWFLFDSHGVDRPGFSTLVSFAKKERILELICSSLDAVSDLEGYSEFDRMRLGTYSLFVIHFKQEDPEKK